MEPRKRLSSVAARPTAPAASNGRATNSTEIAARAPRREGPPTRGPSPRVPTVTTSKLLRIPSEPQNRNSRQYRNKAVLGFESEFSPAKARDWVHTYNKFNDILLTVVKDLPNSYVVQVDLIEQPDAIQILVATSPLAAGTLFASVNAYTEFFAPCNQPDFLHLVTVNIPNGSKAIFCYIKYIITRLGKYVSASLGADHRHISGDYSEAVPSTLPVPAPGREHLLREFQLRGEKPPLLLLFLVSPPPV